VLQVEITGCSTLKGTACETSRVWISRIFCRFPSFLPPNSYRALSLSFHLPLGSLLVGEHAPSPSRSRRSLGKDPLLLFHPFPPSGPCLRPTLPYSPPRNVPRPPRLQSHPPSLASSLLAVRHHRFPQRLVLLPRSKDGLLVGTGELEERRRSLVK